MPLLFIFVFVLTVLVFVLTFYLIIQGKKNDNLLKEQERAFNSFERIFQIILEDLDFDSVIQKIADTIPKELQFGTGVLAIYDEGRRVLRRVAASRTLEAQNAIKALKVPFNKIEIGIDDPNNLMAKSLRERKPFVTNDVYNVLGPVITREESSQIQHIMGTKTTFIYPIFLNDRPLGVFLASTSKEQSQLTSYELKLLKDFVNLIGLIIQNSKLFTSLKETKVSMEKMTEQIYSMNARLHQLDKLKDDFVSVASHELRTPMTAIRSYAWMALNRSDVPLSEKLKKYLSRTMVSTERLINLVNDMLNISRIESGLVEIIPKAFDIKQLAKDVADEVSAKAKEKNINVVVQETNIPKVFADPDKVHQVLLNLVGNSAKFTPFGGSITVSFFTDGQFVDISIKDTGVGISKDDMSRLFTKFGRLDNSYVAAATTGGTGLGLFICKSLVELMKGKIWASSEGVGKGTVFTFSLPIATETVIKEASKYSNVVPEDKVKYLEPVAI